MTEKAYTVMQDSSVSEFCSKVQHLLSEGWQLVGGVSVTGDSETEHRMYHQALTKEFK